ncbi:hypothetical protein [Pedobacter sp. Bi36]|uniref:hypothetical protein n=1 Tax=Pedobacter sp. Bi36 TaxID=2822352 RepID=UPI001E39AAD9|nr:hypothetical protein [Pedobacter sp. Bi36]
MDVKPFVCIIPLTENQLGKGFSTKLHLEKLAPPGRTLFIDSDCLIYGNIQSIFDRFAGHAVSVIGDFISKGEWFGDIESICKKLRLKKIPKFNGGVYYLENGDLAKQIYETAQNLERRYDEIGFVKLRGTSNDEVLMAVAMEMNGQNPILDDGTIMGDLQACQGDYKLNVIEGHAELSNPAYPSPLHQSWYPHTTIHPLIVHFLGYYTQHHPYLLDAYRLRKKLENNLTIWNRLKGNFTIKYPSQLKSAVKNIFRPLFHCLFGYRSIGRSERDNIL